MAVHAHFSVRPASVGNQWSTRARSLALSVSCVTSLVIIKQQADHDLRRETQAVLTAHYSRTGFHSAAGVGCRTVKKKTQQTFPNS